MPKEKPPFDFTAARGSNTGDIYHELWAARHALRLLNPDDALAAMTVEGVTAAEGKDAVWDGVDGAFYYGQPSIADADRVEIFQLKYSGSDASAAWTPARLCAGKSGTRATSPIRRLADAYQKIRSSRAGKAADSIRVVLATNQPISSELSAAFEEARRSVPGAYGRAWKSGKPDLHRMVHASGLEPLAFSEFARVLDLEGESGSRFAAEDGVLMAISQWKDIELKEAASRLRDFIRQRMLPESAGELITRERVLVQLGGVSDAYALFPCPPKLVSVDAAVPRAIAQEVVRRMVAGTQHLCLHGGGGVGKTTALQQIQDQMPNGSQTVVFDCYGGGSFLDASALRHRPQEAFVQIANELAHQLRLPLLLVASGTVDFPRAFRKRLELAAESLAVAAPYGLLLIVADAADNSVLAAGSRTPPEVSFVHDLMSMGDLPQNVRILISARTGRLGDLRLPPRFTTLLLPGFDLAETTANVRRYRPAPDAWIQDFHHFSGGLPRVQSYAFKNAGTVLEDALDALRPAGKDLHHVFREQFDEALRKNVAGELAYICAGLICMPRPIPLKHLATVLGLSEATVADVCADLAPGVRCHADVVSFADEDFEDFVRQAGEPCITDVRLRVAEHLMKHADADGYAALNVAPALFRADRGRELLDLSEWHPEPPVAAMPDPIRREEVRVQRLKLAIGVCRKSDDVMHALRFLLMGTEAMKTEQATIDLLVAHPALAARFARETSSRLILSNPDKVAAHGPLLLHLRAADAARGDAISARENKRRIDAWMIARRDDIERQRREEQHPEAWAISREDAVAAVYARLLLDGPGAAAAHLKSLRPRRGAYVIWNAFAHRLIAEGKLDLAEQVAAHASRAHALFVLVPLSLAGRVDGGRIASGLAALQRRIGPDIRRLDQSYSDDEIGPLILDTALTATEILVARGPNSEAAVTFLRTVLHDDVRRIDGLNEFRHGLIDAILRAVTLTDAMEGRATDVDHLFTARVAPPSDEIRRAPPPSDSRDRNLRDLVKSFLGLYVARASLLVASKMGAALDTARLVAGSESLKRDSWSVDQRRASHLLRGKAAESVAVLLVVEVPAATVLEVSLEVSRGWDMRDPRKLFYRLAAVPSLHDAMLTGLEQTAVSERSDRAGAEERSQRLALYAHLIGAISEGDAQEVFRSAIAVASELDMEMQDQLLFIRHMVERSREEIGPGRRKVAIALGEVIHDAAVRLPEKHFPWHAAVGALARLDLPVALAAAARWEDARVVRLQHTLGHITLTGLEGNELSVAQATALLSLAPDLSGDPWSEVVAHAEKTSGGSTLADELARDMLLHREQHGASVEEFVARAGVGHWSDRFRSYRVFKANSGLNALAQGRFRRDEETHQAVAASPPMGWPPASLIEAESLGIEAQRRTEESRENGHYVSISDHFEHAAAQVSRIHRVAHLEALRVLDLEWEDDDVLWALLGRIHDWKSHGAVRTWAERHAADLVSLRLPALCRQVRRRTNELGSLWEMAGAAGVPVHEVLLQGLERNLDHFDVASALTVATLLCEQIDGSDIAAVCAWYVARLDQRIGPSFREEVPASAVPDSVEVAIARTMFACLSDVDVRVRWRCAHALRRLARMQDQDTVDAVVAEYTRREEHAFRATRAPLYWVSARLWLTIALDRMALESPAIVSRHGIHLIAVACDESFPHILISDFARDAAMKLIDSGHLKTDVEVTAGLERVNRSPLPRDTKSRPYGETFDSLQPLDGNLRFRFDAIDTLRYWYDPMLRAFSSVSPSEFLRVAEHWIVDEWCASPDGDGHVAEPREALFDQRMWRLSSHSHGSRPTVEKLQAYLEWNAMWCAAGDLLKTAPLAALQYGEDDFHYQLKSGKVTVPPIWLADLATPPPLQDSRWRTPTAPVADWVEATSDDELLAEVLPEDTADYVVVHAHIDDASRSYRQTTRVSSALVSPATAHALVRSLQTTHDSSNFYICPEGDECEIDEVGFKLTGWLASHDGDSRLDDKDVFANGIHRLEFAPGVAVSKTLGLMPRYDHGARWYREGEHRPTFIYEAWGKQGDESDHDAHYGNTTESSGHRLLVRKSDLAEFLRKKKRDLIVESEITRRVPEKDGHTHDPEKPKRVEFERILLFRRDGLVQGAERDFGSWRSLGT